MPFTPFHVPANAVAGYPLRRHADLPTLMLANVAMDLEPAIRNLLNVNPPHGPVHTLLGGAAVGAATGWLVRRGVRTLARRLGDDYPLSLRAAVVSGVAGCWLHIALDAVMYDHIHPLFPLQANPVHWPGSGDALHLIAAALLAPALAVFLPSRNRGTLPQKMSLALLLLAAVGMGASVAVGAAP